ncbi:MAG TPA: hypothetical protein VJ011_03455, partial [Steroidobacteraceae bacterium]|nr:hypothetical protein [Steroidobacteraceae bacterium]
MTPPHAKADHVTPYDRLAWSDTEVEGLLARGAHRDELTAYFGADEYRDLVRLARTAHRAPLAHPLRVIVVPGIMGSQLGLRRRVPLPSDILWLDPIDIQIGRLATLRLPSKARIVALGAVLFTYLRLKLQLRAAGFDTVLYHYDWRQPLEKLGQELA